MKSKKLILHSADKKYLSTRFSTKTNFIVVFKTKSNKSASEEKKKNPHKEDTPQTSTALQKRVKLCDFQKFKKKKKGPAEHISPVIRVKLRGLSVNSQTCTNKVCFVNVYFNLLDQISLFANI